MAAARSAVIGLDIGTSVVKGVLVPGDGRVVARASRSQALDIGPGGRVAVDAAAVAGNARRVISQLADRADRAGLRVVAVCPGGSGDEAVWLDEARRPVARVPMSLDTSDAAAAATLMTAVGADRFRALTGLPTSGAYPITRLVGLRAARPDLAARVSHMLAWPEAVALDLGVEVTAEPSLAARTGAWEVASDAADGHYHPALFAAADVSADVFPRVVPTGSVLGMIPAQIAETLDLPPDVRLVGGGFDQALATLGAGVTTTGMAHVGAGSWQAVTILADDRPSVDLVVDGFSIGPSIAAGQRWSVMASGPGTIVLHWLGRVADTAGDPAKRIAALAWRAPDEPTGLTVLPDLGGGAPPHPDPFARGVIAGMGLGHGSELLARALLEGVAIGLRERLERAGVAGLDVGELRVTGGGARDRRWRQLTADVTGFPVRAVDPPDAGAVAAAGLAAAAAGLAPDVLAALARTVRIGPPVSPREDRRDAYRLAAERTAALRRSIATVQRTDRDT